MSPGLEQTRICNHRGHCCRDDRSDARDRDEMPARLVGAGDHKESPVKL
jgi:hypothetical protein